MDGVGVRIAWAREQRDLKQYWVANEAALDRARYNHIEKGKAKRIFMDELARIADVLRCSIDWLVRGGKLDPWLPGEAPAREEHGSHGGERRAHPGRT